MLQVVLIVLLGRPARSVLLPVLHVMLENTVWVGRINLVLLVLLGHPVRVVLQCARPAMLGHIVGLVPYVYNVHLGYTLVRLVRLHARIAP